MKRLTAFAFLAFPSPLCAQEVPFLSQQVNEISGDRRVEPLAALKQLRNCREAGVVQF